MYCIRAPYICCLFAWHNIRLSDQITGTLRSALRTVHISVSHMCDIPYICLYCMYVVICLWQKEQLTVYTRKLYRALAMLKSTRYLFKQNQCRQLIIFFRLNTQSVDTIQKFHHSEQLTSYFTFFILIFFYTFYFTLNRNVCFLFDNSCV